MPTGKARVVLASTLFDVLGTEWFCVAAVRGLEESDVWTRLGAADLGPPPRCPIGGVAEHFGPDSWAVPGLLQARDVRQGFHGAWIACAGFHGFVDEACAET